MWHNSYTLERENSGEVSASSNLTKHDMSMSTSAGAGSDVTLRDADMDVSAHQVRMDMTCVSSKSMDMTFVMSKSSDPLPSDENDTTSRIAMDMTSMASKTMDMTTCAAAPFIADDSMLDCDEEDA